MTDTDYSEFMDNYRERVDELTTTFAEILIEDELTMKQLHGEIDSAISSRLSVDLVIGALAFLLTEMSVAKAVDIGEGLSGLN